MAVRDLYKLALVFTALFYVGIANSADNLSWQTGFQPVHQAGPGSAVVGKRWSLGSRSSDLNFYIHLDAQTNMERGNWYGEIRSYEKFYVKTYVVDHKGRKKYLKLKGFAAQGPDSIHGIWKEGKETARVQSVVFDLTREQLNSISKFSAIIIAYSSYKNKDKTKNITFPLDTFRAKLSELDSSVTAQGGRLFLMTENQIKNTPMRSLPQSYRNKWQKSLKQVSLKLSRPINDLNKLSINGIKKLIKDTEKSAKRKQHQAIYSQQPNWLDLNVCPKPDVSYCRNIGREAYTNDLLFAGNFSYGKIKGVIWRSKGSIVRVYGGSIDLGIDPEIYRAKSAAYYYIVSKKGSLEIRAAKNMLIR